ncbi:MAG: hypothetical protein RLZZ248_112 [Bacteroidota bacterium]|jgi:hypothetical protein
MKWIWGLYFWMIAPALWSQDHQWWVDNVGWDGETAWTQYLIFSPGRMGPNALPVPSFSNGQVDSSHHLSWTNQLTFTKGESTYSTILEAQYVPLPHRLSFRLFWMPLEWFRTSHFLKTERKVFHEFYDDQTAMGDVYLETSHALIHRSHYSAVLRLGYKFAASSHLGAARFTDTPGYYFDISFVRNFPLSTQANFALSAMTGLYIWQTNNSPVHRQNDAFLYSVQLKLNHTYSTFILGLGGYIGYLNNGDQPHLMELGYRVERSAKWAIQITGRKGVNKDWPFTSLAIQIIKKIRT